MALKNKVTKVSIEEITNYTKEEAEKAAQSMKNPVIIPVFVAADSEEGTVDHIFSSNLSDLFMNKEIVSYTELEYHIYKSLRLDLIKGKIDDLQKGKDMLEEWLHKEKISKETMDEMNSRFDSEIEGTLPEYNANKYLDDIDKLR
ncbi:hypothetical protein ACFVIX_06430 [Bacillus subtilis]